MNSLSIQCLPNRLKSVALLGACTTAFFIPVLFPTEAIGLGQLAGSGRVTTALSLASGGAVMAPGGANSLARVVITSTPGAADSTDMIDFGEIASGTGAPIQAGIYLNVRGNANYRLNISESSFTANNLRYRDQDISGTTDRGSFVQIRVGNLAGTGSKANVTGSSVDGVMQTGMPLHQLAQGQVTASSSRLCGGSAPSLGGVAGSADNAIQVPVYFIVPSGLELGPSRGSLGSFQVTLQLGVFAQ